MTTFPSLLANLCSRGCPCSSSLDYSVCNFGSDARRCLLSFVIDVIMGKWRIVYIGMVGKDEAVKCKQRGARLSVRYVCGWNFVNG